MSKLYQETKDLVEMRRAMEEENIPTDAIKDTLLANAGEFEKKAVALYQAGDEIDYDLQMLDAMISDLKARKAALEERKAGMRSVLLEAMLTTGITQISCPYFTISTKKGQRSVIIDSEEDIPDQYVTTEVINKVDKRAIGAALSGGEQVAGAHLSEAGVSLQVRKRS